MKKVWMFVLAFGLIVGSATTIASTAWNELQPGPYDLPLSGEEAQPGPNGGTVATGGEEAQPGPNGTSTV
jgi:hypothetical protein